MDKFRSRINALIATFAGWLIGIALCTPAMSQIALNRLTDCKQIDEAFILLNSSGTDDCGIPQDEIGRILDEQTAFLSTELCFIKPGVAAAPDGFACILDRHSAGAGLTCYRETRLGDIEAYKRDFGGTPSKEASAYAKSAASCPLSNGDAAQAVDSLMPAILRQFAKFEFGFIAGLGDQRIPTAAALHGFARRINTSRRSGLEFFSVYESNETQKRRKPTISAGQWAVEIDDASDFFSEFAEIVSRSAGTEIDIRSRGLQLVSRARNKDSHETRLDLLRDAQDSVARYLEQEGFHELGDDFFRQHVGMSRAQMVQTANTKMAKGLGAPESIRLAPFLRAFASDRLRSCAQRGDGLVGFYLLPGAPIPNVMKDYGDIHIMAFAIGSCSFGNSPNVKRYLAQSFDQITTGVVDSLPR